MERVWICRVGVAMAAFLAATIGSALAQTTDWRARLSSPMTQQESQINEEIQSAVAAIIDSERDRLPQIGNPLRPVKSVRLLADSVIALNLDTVDPKKKISTGDLERFGEGLSAIISDKFERENFWRGGVVFFFDGRLPEEFYDVGRTSDDRTRRHSAAETGPIVVSAAHGMYYNYKEQKWDYQREIFYSVLEDTLTPKLSGWLSQYLRKRSKSEVKLARSTSRAAHPEAGVPFLNMASRYYVEKMLPNRPDIWASNSLKNPKSLTREYDDDINVRPYYANYLGAAGLLSIHTNGRGLRRWRRGFMVLHHLESNKTLAENIVCYFEELQTTSDLYLDFPVWGVEKRVDKGELNLAEMPTVIVETAYHDRKEEARALKDPVFQQIAMKAVEKGWRLTVERKPCERFRISGIPTARGPHNKKIPVSVSYNGYPQFPVVLDVKVVECPVTWTCTGGSITYSDPVNSPIKYSWTCTAPADKPAASFKIETMLTDDDGVRTDPVQHTVLCQPGGANVVHVRAGSELADGATASLNVGP